jgi:serine/threonine protein kinase
MVLGIKRGDMSILPGESFRCTPSDPNLFGVPLVLKKIDCVDRRLHDAKVFEFDTLIRMRGHPNLVQLYSYWSEPATSHYQYKSLIGLFEEAKGGNMLTQSVKSAIRPTSRQCLKYLIDLCKALLTLHSANIVHGAVKPSRMYIQADKTVVLGVSGKIELDAARNTHQLFSKALIRDAIPHTMIYWAPEVLMM